MSQGHPWLRFDIGVGALPHRLADDPRPWQQTVSDLHGRWYDGVAPPAVADVFVLQWLLQVPAHTAATAAAAGPWRVEGLDDLTFTRTGTGVPAIVRLTTVVPGDGDLGTRLERAEADYRALAAPLAAGYAARVPLGRRTRGALVDDMWAEADRQARGAAPPTSRRSCCLIYALPGCHECAGCPRVAGNSR
ncbi:(2Fe-2S)-binding protein [Phycicoccus flavus]|uniref:(2Fe-2S)-binding protein n=1 Tax=Phycicoccus flavus TaxID=2502783 RepID=UPI000FEB9E7C|nr:(2Fe-2S)-binding protein [Phycicoccus flavus]NHA67173.1 (2Fe-2S)-binding protein [Phycicoccus flavus]